MNILQDVTGYRSSVPNGIALGNFDGVHLGHKKLIETLSNRSVELGLSTMVFTFEPHPSRVLNPSKNMLSLTSLSEKIKIIEGFKINTMVVAHFNKTFSMIKPEDFVKNILCNKLKAGLIVVGFDYRFGYKGLGDTELLSDLGSKYNFEVIVIPPVKKDGSIISSSLIREFISKGYVSKAAECLGRPYKIKGTIIRGLRIGHMIGFPTANVDLVLSKVLPANGVYAVACRIENNEYDGVANLGIKPTFSKNNITLEVHLIGLNEEVYGKTIEVEFIEKIREEITFDSLNSLAAQIGRDKQVAQRLIYIYKTKMHMLQ
jgi:riboflavin kinase/FMN adenylyltransferase